VVEAQSGPGKIVVRKATLDDVEAMSRVLIASISQLCERDHGGDPQHIARWVANKSPESVRSWLANPQSRLFVAERNGNVVGVGSFNDGGEIQLNYVAPEARFSGVSKAMLSCLEREMSSQGIRRGTLTSTRTAHDLYLSAGWADIGTSRWFGVEVQSMTKNLG
jgi:N-acetylglutamate synthase-like GNAT family acetyltransferase